MSAYFIVKNVRGSNQTHLLTTTFVLWQDSLTDLLKQAEAYVNRLLPTTTDTIDSPHRRTNSSSPHLDLWI